MNTVTQMFGKLETNPKKKPATVARGKRFGVGLHHKQGHGTAAGGARMKSCSPQGDAAGRSRVRVSLGTASYGGALAR